MHSSDATTTKSPLPSGERPPRLLLLLIAAFAFGLLIALVKGPDGDGVSTISRLRFNLADLSAPWLMVAFIAGRRSNRAGLGALLGSLATMSALLGFYLLTSLVLAEDLGGHGILDNFGRELLANRTYLVGGALSGLLFGALGAWRRVTRSLDAGVLAGVLLVGEPIAIAAHVVPLRPPLLVSIDAVQIAVYAAEVALGLVVLLVVLSRSAGRSTGATLS